MAFRGTPSALRALAAVETVAELQAIDTTILDDGATVVVASLVEVYVLRKGSVAPADGVNIVAPDQSAGRWLRSSTASSAVYGAQTVWYLDPVNGDDANDGLTQSTAIKTRKELAQRLTSPTVITGSALTVNVLNDVPAGDPFVVHPRYGTSPVVFGSVVIQGQQPTTLFSGTLTGAVVPNPATNQRASVTINGIDWATAGPGGTSLVGFRIRRTTDNALSWVQAPGGAADTAFCPRPTNASTGSNAANWAIGNTIVVERLTDWGDPFSFRWQQAYGFVQPRFIDLQCVNGAADGLIESEWCVFQGCEFSALRYNMISGQNIACKLTGSLIHSTSVGLDTSGCWLELAQIAQAAQISLNHCSCTQSLTLSRSSVLIENGLEMWDWSGAALVADDNVDCRQVSGTMWGTSAVAGSYGINVSAGYSRVRYSALPNIIGALSPGQDVLINGNALAYAGLPYIHGVSAVEVSPKLGGIIQV